jgi:pyrimidine operon attenuation protein/uracil phosphoribosyltransferase
MDAARMKRALSRLASEIVEENQGAKDLYIVGIRRRGVPLAERVAAKIEELEGEKPLYGIIDITLYRDDFQPSARIRSSIAPSSTPTSKTKKSFSSTTCFTRDERFAPRSIN